jgi:Ca2+/Na+ antiporter
MRVLDWPALVAVAWLTTVFLARGRIGGPEGASLLAAYALYVATHVVFG